MLRSNVFLFSFAALSSAAFYESLLAKIEDLEDKQLVMGRVNGPFIELSINDL